MDAPKINYDSLAPAARSADYEDGYDAAQAQAAAAVQEMDRKIKRMEQLFWCAVASAGGTLAIPRRVLRRFDNPTWTVTEDHANDCVVYKVTV